MSIPVKIIPETRRVHQIRYLRFDWVDNTAGGLLVHEGIIHPIVSVSTLTWFIRYIYYWNLQFLNNVIIIKTKVRWPQAYAILADFGSLVYFLPETLICLAFQSFDMGVPDGEHSRNAPWALT